MPPSSERSSPPDTPRLLRQEVHEGASALMGRAEQASAAAIALEVPGAKACPLSSELLLLVPYTAACGCTNLVPARLQTPQMYVYPADQCSAVQCYAPNHKAHLHQHGLLMVRNLLLVACAAHGKTTRSGQECCAPVVAVQAQSTMPALNADVISSTTISTQTIPCRLLQTLRGAVCRQMPERRCRGAPTAAQVPAAFPCPPHASSCTSWYCPGRWTLQASALAARCSRFKSYSAPEQMPWLVSGCSTVHEQYFELVCT